MIERRVLSDEHDAILQIASTILGLVAQRDFTVIEVIKLRWRLAHSLAVHLAKEDKIIYPRLKRHSNAHVAGLADRYEREMGGLAAAYQSYMAEWNGESIAAGRDVFREQTKQVLALLARRVEKEEAELYPMYERAMAQDCLTMTESVPLSA